ncbi:MAG: hypothetical protein J6V34_03390, partial [Oscillospiraceae bacterium]|nr:hypothetical protein [Oscillospiraceae bacterium]
KKHLTNSICQTDKNQPPPLEAAGLFARREALIENSLYRSAFFLYYITARMRRNPKSGGKP